MGAIGGMLGLAGGASGTGFAAPAQANLETQQGVPLGNAAGEAYYRNQAALASQQRLLGALQGQGGLQKQTDVYGQLQDIAAGKGPNPAQAMLNQRTGENVANQAALMAGQRGASANVGLMARQAAQAGSGIQQQAVGQGATMQANQSLGAINQAGNLANTMASNQIAGTNAATNAEQAQYGNLMNALAQQNQQRIASQSSVNAGNAGLAQTGMGGQQQMLGGMMSGAAMMVAHGGMIPGYADGGGVGPQSSFGQFLTTVNAPSEIPLAAPMPSGGGSGDAIKGGMEKLSGAIKPQGTIENYNPNTAYSGPSAGPWSPKMAGPAAALKSGGGMVDVVLSPGEKVVPPNKVNEAAGGKVEAKTVPGKAHVPGDSVKNDTYQTKLPEGSIVVPRTKAKDAGDAAAFVRKILAQRGRGK